ncbi:MAG TPA: flagellar biosynthetic protein FliR [Symbiobacteriaceae bacterium]|nr:flagellar biosynthetic protein FliR [Symbiobacteriaceae bacterium]
MDELLAQVPTILLVSSRVAGLTTISPVFANRFIPAPLRVAFTFLLAIILLPVVSGHVAADVMTGTGLLAGCVLELLIGLTLGFIGQLVFAAVQMAGALIDLDMGFLNAQIFDPVSGRSEPLTSTFFQALALTLYLAMNGHHMLIRALAGSYELIAAGGFGFTAAGPLHVANLFGAMLSAAIQMVLPFMAVMLLATMAMAGLTRAVPQLHIFSVGMGAKAVAGLAFVTLLMPYLLAFLERLYDAGNAELLRTLGLMR